MNEREKSKRFIDFSREVFKHIGYGTRDIYCQNSYEERYNVSGVLCSINKFNNNKTFKNIFQIKDLVEEKEKNIIASKKLIRGRETRGRGNSGNER
ncbi:hypothetical protein [Fusobacterium sp. SYSU M8D902]|uniref:hypothetical protein n=1 Tax=Fusobacterium sp. SYSU M8D902 TaxID=3159562 RepID=UPI0032E3C12F